MKGRIREKVSVGLYALTFLMIYTPSFFSDSVANYLMPFLYTGVSFFLVRKVERSDKFTKAYRRLLFFLLIAALYFCIRAIFAGVSMTDIVHLRLIQSLQFIVTIVGVYNVCSHLTSIGYSENKKIQFLLNVCVIQFAIVLIMVAFPDLRSALLDRFYQNGEGNFWTMSKRVYGVMLNYTFAGAIFHGMMAVVAYYYGITKNKKFLIYIPMLLMMVLLNGRTGLLVCIIGIAICTFMLIGRKNILKILKYGLITVMSFLLIFQILKNAFPSTYDFVVDGLGDMASAFSSDDEKTGNVSILSDHFSKDMNVKSLIVGDGYRIQEKGDIPDNLDFDYAHSDMGYLNDMFMGGLPYMLMLYIPTIALIMTRRKNDIGSLALSIFLLTIVLICNIKGEVFRSSMIVSGIVFIKAAMEQTAYNEKKLAGGDSG